MIVEADIKDPRIAAWLCSNPIKNTTMLFMYVNMGGFKSPWMLIDGCFDRDGKQYSAWGHVK